MKKEYKHEVKISLAEVLENKPIYEKAYHCINCNEKLRMKINKGLTILLSFIVTMFSVLIIIPHCIELFSDESFFIRYGYIVLIIIGIANLFLWIVNLLLWLFRKRIKYVKIEDK